MKKSIVVCIALILCGCFGQKEKPVNVNDSLDKLISVVKESHLAGDPASDNDIEKLKRRNFPDDFVDFYKATNGSYFHSSDDEGNFTKSEKTWEWNLLPVEEIKPVSEMGFIDEESPLYEASKKWMTIVDAGDGNYLAIDVSEKNRGKVIDCFHEAVGDVGYNAIISLSFKELIVRLLNNRKPFWLEDEKFYGSF